MIWFQHTAQPAQRSFGIEAITVAGRPVPVRETSLGEGPFHSLRMFRRADAPSDQRHALLVAPMSGHFAVLFREMVIGLLADFTVVVTDWINAAHVACEAGTFCFDDNIAVIVDALSRQPPNSVMIATCQGTVPALAAAALHATSKRGGDAHRAPADTLSAIVVMAGPVDPAMNPTRVSTLICERPMQWFDETVVRRVPRLFPGGGRRVYPGDIQLAGLHMYWTRHFLEGRELFRKTFADDGCEPLRFPFMDLYTSIMDLPAECFLESIDAIFHRRALARQSLRWRNERVDLSALETPALLTIEGQDDDVSAPGQTFAAHDLCSRIHDARRGHLLVPGSGHFSLFHGRVWRNRILPAVRAFLNDHGAAD